MKTNVPNISLEDFYVSEKCNSQLTIYSCFLCSGITSKFGEENLYDGRNEKEL